MGGWAPPASKRLLSVTAFLARILHASGILVGGYPVRRAALAAFCLDSRLSLSDRDGFSRQRLANQPLGLFTLCLFGHGRTRYVDAADTYVGRPAA